MGASVMARRVRMLALAGTMLAPLAMAAPAAAQVAQARVSLDENGVDLATGKFHFSLSEASVGANQAALGVDRIWNAAGSFSDGLPGTLSKSGTTITLYDGLTVKKFTSTGSGWASATGDGSTLVRNATGTSYTYTATSGLTVTYSNPSINPDPGDAGSQLCSELSQSSCYLVATDVTQPDGQGADLVWELYRSCSIEDGGPFGTICIDKVRLDQIENSSGYRAEMFYATNTYGPDWDKRTSAKLFAPGSSTATDELTYSNPDSLTTQVSTASGETWLFKKDSAGRLQSVQLTGESAPSTSVTYHADDRVASVTKRGVTTSYAWSSEGGLTKLTRTGGPTGTLTVLSDPALELPESVTNAAGNTTSYVRDGEGRIIKVTAPEGNFVEYEYGDPHGRLVKVERTPEGGGAAQTIYEANYVQSCANSCWRKKWEKDANGIATDYDYDPNGLLVKVRQPGANSASPRPTTYYDWDQRTASATGVTQWKLIEQRICTTAADCAGTADERVVQYDYRPSDLLLSSVTVKAGDGSIVATTSYTYDSKGDLVTVDGPLATSNDTIHYQYDARRRPVGVVGPDPDGTGARPRVAQQIAYDARGVATTQRVGTTSTTSASGMTVSRSSVSEVDANYRVTKQTLYKGLESSGDKVSVTQNSYDSVGRLDCTAVRNNLASIPASVCSAGTPGANAPDIIKKRVYDSSGRLIELRSGIAGTPEYGVEEMRYTPNGQVAWVEDADNNRTSYSYDGHDRLSQIAYPVATAGAQASSASDVETFTYDVRDLVATRIDRAGQTHSYGYNWRHQLVSIDPPGASNTRLYTHDMVGNLVNAYQPGVSVNFTYDALGRQTYTNYGTFAYQYDKAGRRTRMTHGDGVYFTYEYDDAGNLLRIKENGAHIIAYFEYDDLGQRSRKWLNYSGTHKVKQSYTRDSAGRLTAHATDISGSTSDLTQTFTYTPAGQIASVTRSKDEFAWTDHENKETNWYSNGLNQYTAIDPLSPSNEPTAGFAHDARGNLTQFGPMPGTGLTRSFTYDAENFLTSATVNGATTTLTYDPLGRLLEQVDGNGTRTKFRYDGLNLAFENDANGNILRRYVHVPGSNEPLIWYEGAAVNGSTRRMLATDERGSVQSVNKAYDGEIVSLNSYGPHGETPDVHVARFGYTGQAWMPELGLYYYKARFYTPELGRFMQTDPIGYADGLNWYNYVGSDPVNYTDPLGHCRVGYDMWGRVDSQGWKNLGHWYYGYESCHGGRDFQGPARRYSERPEMAAAADDIVVTGSPHDYDFDGFAFCSPGDLFNTFRQAGRSAPGAPYAQDGLTEDIELIDGSLITQLVLPDQLRIINFTQEGHRYHPGTVTIQISPYWTGSAYLVEGRGSGPKPQENVAAGWLFFKNMSEWNTIECSFGSIL